MKHLSTKILPSSKKLLWNKTVQMLYIISGELTSEPLKLAPMISTEFMVDYIPGYDLLFVQITKNWLKKSIDSVNLSGVPTSPNIRVEIFWLTTSLSENWLVQIASRWQWSSVNNDCASFPHPLSISSGDSFSAVLLYDLTGLWCCEMLAGTNQTFFSKRIIYCFFKVN